MRWESCHTNSDHLKTPSWITWNKTMLDWNHNEDRQKKKELKYQCTSNDSRWQKDIKCSHLSFQLKKYPWLNFPGSRSKHSSLLLVIQLEFWVEHWCLSLRKLRSHLVSNLLSYYVSESNKSSLSRHWAEQVTSIKWHNLQYTWHLLIGIPSPGYG